MEALHRVCGPDATDDTDAGHVDCDFVSSPFLPCGVREVNGMPRVSHLLEKKDEKGCQDMSDFREPFALPQVIVHIALASMVH